MRILSDQDERSATAFAYPDRAMLLVWGIAYLLGYLPLALSAGEDALLDLPLWFALGSLFAAIVIGIALSISVSVRYSRGVRGDSARKGMLYGFAWWFSFLGIAGLGRRLGDLNIDGDQSGIIINGASMMLVAAMFMAGGAIWLDTTQFVVGVAISLATAIALFMGLPAYYWIMMFGVGGTLLLAAAAHGRIGKPSPGSTMGSGHG